MGWLVRDNEVLSSLQIADSRSARRRGLLGRTSFDEAMYFPKTRSVHTFGMKFDLDVAFVDEQLTVVRLVELRPGKITRPVVGAAGVIEAQAGTFREWNLAVGDVLEIH